MKYKKFLKRMNSFLLAIIFLLQPFTNVIAFASNNNPDIHIAPIVTDEGKESQTIITSGDFIVQATDEYETPIFTEAEEDGTVILEVPATKIEEVETPEVKEEVVTESSEETVEAEIIPEEIEEEIPKEENIEDFENIIEKIEEENKPEDKLELPEEVEKETEDNIDDLEEDLENSEENIEYPEEIEEEAEELPYIANNLDGQLQINNYNLLPDVESMGNLAFAEIMEKPFNLSANLLDLKANEFIKDYKMIYEIQLLEVLHVTDYYTVELSKYLSLKTINNIVDIDGNQIAEADYDEITNTITYTFTEEIEKFDINESISVEIYLSLDPALENYQGQIGLRNLVAGREITSKIQLTKELVENTLKLQVKSPEGQVLEGALFGIYDADGNIVTEERTNPEGQIDFGQLEDGFYILKELQAPEGYLTDEKIYEFIVEEGQITFKEDLTNIVENTKIEKEIKAQIEETEAEKGFEIIRGEIQDYLNISSGITNIDLENNIIGYEIRINPEKTSITEETQLIISKEDTQVLLNPYDTTVQILNGDYEDDIREEFDLTNFSQEFGPEFITFKRKKRLKDLYFKS